MHQNSHLLIRTSRLQIKVGIEGVKYKGVVIAEKEVVISMTWRVSRHHEGLWQVSGTLKWRKLPTTPKREIKSTIMMIWGKRWILVKTRQWHLIQTTIQLKSALWSHRWKRSTKLDIITKFQFLEIVHKILRLLHSNHEKMLQEVATKVLIEATKITQKWPMTSSKARAFQVQ